MWYIYKNERYINVIIFIPIIIQNNRQVLKKNTNYKFALTIFIEILYLRYLDFLFNVAVKPSKNSCTYISYILLIMLIMYWLIDEINIYFSL